MFRETEFRERCKVRGLDDIAMERAVASAGALAAAASGPDGTFATADIEAVNGHLAGIIAGEGSVTEADLYAFARYAIVTGNKDVERWLYSVMLPIGVIPEFRRRFAEAAGDAVAEAAFVGVSVPPSGAAPTAYPPAASRMVRNLLGAVGEERARELLCHNVHGIPRAAHEGERKRLLELSSVDAWLADYHRRQVETLSRHEKDGMLWFEQKITRAVVDWVASEPTVLGGKREGRKILVTKIPYDPDSWLVETDQRKRRFLACHCPLAASTILDGGEPVDPAWCACSSGYEKVLFDVAFGAETKVKVVSSVLAGDDMCRFELEIPDGVPL